MNLTIQDLVHYLLAAGGAVALDQSGIYLLSEKDNDLNEKLWTGTEVADQVFIASDVKQNTSALYLLDESERYVFFIDTKNMLRCYKYDPDEEAWDEAGPRNDQKIVVLPSSKLSGGVVLDSKVIVFEDLSDQFQIVKISDDGRWGLQSPIPVKPKQGAPHLIVHSGDSVLHFLYIHQDNTLHHLAQGFGAGEFRDNALPGCEFHHDRVTNFIAIPDDDMKFQVFALLSTGKIILMNREGQRTELGRVDEGRFTPSTSEECVIETMALIKKGIQAVSGKMRKHGK